MEKQRRIKVLSLCAAIIAVIGLTVAFATLSTTLSVNGTSYLDAAKWGIKFQNLSEPSIVGEASDAKTAKIEKDVSIKDIKVTLSKPGDSVTYTVDLVNEGDINAKIENIEKMNLTEEQQKYITFTVKYKENDTELKIGDILSKGEVKPLVIKIKYRKDLESSDLPKSAQEINLSYKLDFVQTDDKADSDAMKTYNVGDEFCLEKECFYVISDNGSTVTALAKYNLFVGNIYNNSENTTTIISKTDSGYGLQNEKAIGWTTYGTEYVGVIAFSDIKYWVDSSNNLLSKYGTSYPANVFDSNSNLYEPLENYKTYLKNTLGKTSVKISLLSYEQAMSLGCNTSNRCYSSPNWLHSTTYWTLSARDENGIWILYSDGDFYDYGFSKDNVRGLRPVITINKSEL